MSGENHLQKNNSFVKKIKSYFDLCKPNVMYLAILSSVAGIFLAPGNISFFNGLLSLIFVSMGAGSAGAFNMYFESEIDAMMERTSKRPLPSWRIKKNHALYFAIFLGISSVLSLWTIANLLSAALLFATIIFYGFIYTLILKKRTLHNVVIGGIPGAIPPLIGWAIVENSLSLRIFSLFFIIFLWIPPHSWALALFKIKEYKKVQIPMLPVIKGRENTINQILAYSIALIISSYSPYFFNLISIYYAFFISFLNFFFIYFSIKLFFDKKDKLNNKFEKRLFLFSINYLLLLLIWIICEKIFIKLF
jgi:protoheme IX farnesyltransferase